MAEIPPNVPSIGESDSLRPLGPPWDRLAEAGRKFIAMASVLEDANHLLGETPPDHPHLQRSGKRLAQLIADLDGQMITARELISIAIVELRLSVTKKA